MYLHSIPLKPRDGFTLMVLAVLRVSTQKQSRSLDAQRGLVDAFLGKHSSGNVNVSVISTCASGEHLDRRELSELIERVQSGRYDVVVCEDLARIARDTEARHICGICVDHQTRVIAINDHLDTCDPNWRDSSLFLSWQNEKHNEMLSQRIKGRLRERFNNGGALAGPIAGYLLPDRSDSLQRFTDQDWLKDDNATPIIVECLRRTLRLKQSDCLVADYLNELGFETGPCCTSKRWNGRSYHRWISNPLLAGLRQRNRRHSVKRFGDGKRVSVLAPADLHMERRCEHLAHMSIDDHEALVRFYEQRAKSYRKTEDGTADIRVGRPKKRTRYPGQAIACGVCGRRYVFGGHGQKNHLMCDGARQHKCWCGVSIDGPLAAMAIGTVIYDHIVALPGFDVAFTESIHEQRYAIESRKDASSRNSQRDLQRMDRQIQNLLGFIRNGHNSTIVADDLRRLENEKRQLLDAQDFQQRPQDNALAIPKGKELRPMFGEAMGALIVEDPEFADVVRNLVSKVVAYPFRLCDGGRIVMRAQMTVNLPSALSESKLSATVEQTLGQVNWVNLFNPPQREAFRERVVADRNHLTQAEVAAKYGITVTAAQHAAALQRKMDALNLTDPYVHVVTPPDDCPKLRRHKHSRYQFEPILEFTP